MTASSVSVTGSDAQPQLQGEDAAQGGHFVPDAVMSSYSNAGETP